MERSEGRNKSVDHNELPNTLPSETAATGVSDSVHTLPSDSNWLSNLMGREFLGSGSFAIVLRAECKLNNNTAYTVLKVVISEKSKSQTSAEGEDWLSNLVGREFLGSGSSAIVLRAECKLNNNTADTVLKVVISEKSKSQTSAEGEDIRLREYNNMNDKSHTNVVCVKNCTKKRFTKEEIDLYFAFDKLNLSDAAKKLVYVIQGRIIEAKDLKVELICIEMELCGPTLRQWLLEDDKHKVLKNNNNFMEHVESEYNVNSSEMDSLKKGPKMILLKVMIGNGIISGLDYLHSQNIIHRDLRPENILFSIGKGELMYLLPIKLADLGLSRNISDSTLLTEDIGCPLYRAPEVNQHGKYGKRADRYSLGLIWFELFETIPQKNLQNAFEQLRNDPAAILDTTHDEYVTDFKQIIHKLTRINESDRYPENYPIVLEWKGQDVYQSLR